MADIPKSTVEIRIATFIAQYGSEELIAWLDEFDFMGGPERFRQFKKVEKFTCDAFGITLADLHGLSKTECTDAKKVISFISFNTIHLKHPVIAKLLGNVSLRSVGYYIQDAENWVANPKANKSFYEAYMKVYQKLNIE